MENKEAQGNKALISTREDARSIIDWQHERYHHLQTLAQGLLGSVLTATAVAATIVTATEYTLPQLPSSPSVYEKAASSFPVLISTDATRSVVLFNYVLSILVGISGLIVLLAASHRLYSVISSRPLEIGISSNNYISIVPQDIYYDMNNKQGIDSVSGNFTKVIKENQIRIEDTNKRFTQGAMRVIVALALILISLYHYYQCSSANVAGLLMINASILLPSHISSKVLKKVLGAKQEDLRRRKTELFQELPFENNALSRWEAIEENRIESILLFSIQLLSFLSLISIFISYINHAVGSPP